MFYPTIRAQPEQLSNIALIALNTSAQVVVSWTQREITPLKLKYVKCCNVARKINRFQVLIVDRIRAYSSRFMNVKFSVVTM